MIDYFYGEHSFEDTLAKAQTPERSGQNYLADIAAELHLSEAELGYFAWTHLSNDDYNPHAGTVSDDGAEALRTFLGREN